MPSRSLDDKCSAVRLYLYAWRVRKRFPHTNATFERNNDANASSEEAMVDVEIDRYIDEHSVSNLNYSLSTLPRLKPADRDNLKLPSHFFSKSYFVRFATLLITLLLSADIRVTYTVHLLGVGFGDQYIYITFVF
jgi:hypothetical protein